MNSKDRGLKPAVNISDKLNDKITWMGKNLLLNSINRRGTYLVSSSSVDTNNED